MGIQDNKLKDLAEKYRTGLCTPEDYKQIRAWYDEFEANGYILPPDNEIERASREAALQVIMQVREQQKNIDSPQTELAGHSIVVTIPKKTAYFARYAAAAVLLVGLSIGAYQYLKPVKHTLAVASQNRTDVLPGGNKAILTLSNGHQIALNNAQNGNLAQQGTTAIHKADSGLVTYQAKAITNKSQPDNLVTAYNTITTPRGGQYQVLLPDGTRAWLNSVSSIHFPVAFTGAERNVETTGEVYFEVAKDKTKPFSVTTAGQTVTVLGTHFNIMAYTDESQAVTTLLEGSVRISKNGQSKILKPGEQALVGQNIKVGTADTDDVIAWKNGLIAFTDADLKTIMRKVSRWYDVDVEYQGQISDRKFTGAISRKVNLSALLKILALNHIQFTLDGNKLIVKQ